MSFGQNLQFLRKMHRGMTQEELAEKMGVSRQTISKWEMDSAFPEMEKAIENRLFQLVVTTQLGKIGVKEFVYAVFTMGSEGLKLEDLTPENVISHLPKPDKED